MTGDLSDTRRKLGATMYWEAREVLEDEHGMTDEEIDELLESRMKEVLGLSEADVHEIIHNAENTDLSE